MEISKMYTISACQSKGIRSNLNVVCPFFQILVSPFFIFCLCSSSSNSCAKSCLIYFKYDNLTKSTTIIAIILTIINLNIVYSHPLCFIFLSGMFGYGDYFLFFILLIIIPTKQMAYIAASHEGSELATAKNRQIRLKMSIMRQKYFICISPP